MLTFLRNLLLLSLLLYGTLYLLNPRYGAGIVHPLAGYILGYFALLTGLIYWVTARLVRANPDNFMAAYFGSMVLRMLLSIGIVVVYLYKGGAHEGIGTYTFLGAFFIGYFLYSGFEVWSVLTNLRPFSKPGADAE